jgi:Protein of unknown function (DUF2950)
MKTVLDKRFFRSKESARMHAIQVRFGLRNLGGTPYVRAAFAAIVLLTAAALRPCLAGAQGQATFASPEEASRALVGAVGRQDERAMTQILGGGKALISAEDAAEDALDRQYFVQKYREMHRWAHKHGGPATLYVGAENWPFPIPLVFDNGAWRFNSSAGSQEILFRRIGENEVVAVGMCKSLLTGAPSSAVVKTHKPILFHGYYFHTLSTSDGGLAAIAYPAVYRTSGVMSFIVTEGGRLSEKDLGPGTAKLAAAMSRYQPDDTWTPVD